MIQTSSPAPLLHLSCTPPAPLLTPAAPLFPAPHQQKLEGFPEDTSNHFKTNAKLCKAFMCVYIELSDVVTCWACMAPLLTSPAPLLTSPAPLLHLSCTCCASCTSPDLQTISKQMLQSLSDMITCWACMAPLRTSPEPLLHLSCTSPAPLLTSPAPLLHLS